MLRIALYAVASAALLAACEDPSKKQPAAAVSSAVPQAAKTPEVPSAAAEILPFSNQGSKIGFVGSKVTGSHEGSFEKFHGTVKLAAGAKLEASSVEVDIDTDSVKSDAEKLTGHLKSPDFFDTAKFPKATFKSTEIKAGGAGGTHTVTGNLNLHGKEKSISFPATVAATDAEVSAKAEFSINRKDFDIVYAGKSDDLIRDGVVLKLDLHAPRGKVVPAKDTPAK